MVTSKSTNTFFLILRFVFVLLVNFIYYHILELTSKYTADHITHLSAKLAK